MAEEKITFLDIIKGILFIIIFLGLSYAIIGLFTILVVNYFKVIENKFILIISLVIGIFVYSVFCGFGKATGETFGVAKGYKALSDLKALFKQKIKKKG